MDWYNLLRTVDKGLGFIAIFYLRDGDIFHSSEPKSIFVGTDVSAVRLPSGKIYKMMHGGVPLV